MSGSRSIESTVISMPSATTSIDMMQNMRIWNQPKPAASRCSSIEGTFPPGDGASDIPH